MWELVRHVGRGCLLAPIDAAGEGGDSRPRQERHVPGAGVLSAIYGKGGPSASREGSRFVCPLCSAGVL